MAFVSMVLGLLIFYSLGSDPITLILGSLASLIFHFMTSPNWKKDALLVLSLVLKVPQSIIEGFLVIFNTEERFYEVEISGDPLQMILTITLSPKSVVIYSEHGKLQVHEVSRI